MNNLPWLASLLKSRNTIDDKIATAIGRTAQANNIGEYIASIIFRIALDETGKRRGYDGRFSFRTACRTHSRCTMASET